ncbi:hypothetical protein Taro_011560 [Colocasia esculenta]|uniref:Tetratricopeptide repeat protein 1 n=1 Tax=Colocasia esculenta TaxID=4460 RepID=A0A843U1R9_COLES|nr:hypothetical protein [Colocasia esculenta]
MVVVIEQDPEPEPDVREAKGLENGAVSSCPDVSEPVTVVKAAGCPAGNGDASEDEAFEDALDEEQQVQRVITQANDAKEEGNKLYRVGNFEEALRKYELALQYAPESPSSAEIRSICHANCAICYSKLWLIPWVTGPVSKPHASSSLVAVTE